MTNNENLLYKSKLSIENKMIIFFIVVIIIIFPIMTGTIVNFTFGIYMLIFFIIPVPFYYYLLSQNQVILFNNRIHYKNFSYQNPKNKFTDIYYKDIKSAEFVKTLIKEQIEINTVNGKYIITSINFQDLIPELKEQLKDNWVEIND